MEGDKPQESPSINIPSVQEPSQLKPEGEIVKNDNAVNEAPMDREHAKAVSPLKSDSGSPNDKSQEPTIRFSTLSKPDHDSIQIIFQDLSYSVTIVEKKKREKIVTEKKILKNINGLFRPGRLTAIMGNSGAGKTSFLNVLAGEVKEGSVSGTILVNGKKMEGKDIKKISGFVFQDDLILATMTVREAITMSAKLRLPSTMDMETKLQRVEEIIELLRLKKAANTMVGNSFIKGISGGERKRTAMAMEMVTNPGILFLDEPTSGLDTFTAFSVMETLSGLAKQGRTVVATIHQPSSDIFHTFDDIIFLSEGHLVYYGAAEKIVEFFGNQGYKCPTYMNPTDYVFMHVLNNSEEIVASEGKAKDGKDVGIKSLQKVIDQWPLTPEAQEMEVMMKNPRMGGVLPTSLIATSSFWSQFHFLMGRAAKNAIRNKFVFISRLFQNTLIGLLIGVIYYDVNSKTFQGQIQNRAGALYFICTQQIMGGMFSVLNVFAAEKVIFIREYNAGYYRLSAFFFSKILVELPFFIIIPFVMALIPYYMIGYQPDAQHLFIHLFSIVLLSNSATAIGLCAAAAFKDIKIALAIVPAIMMPVLIFSGFFVNNGGIPVYFDWIKWLSPVKYGFSAVMQNEFRGLVIGNCPPHANCTGEAILNTFDIGSDLNILENEMVLLGMFFILFIISYLALWRIAH